MSEPKFNVGDRVRCIIEVGSLILGEAYRVTEANPLYVWVIGPGCADDGYLHSRFELAEQAAEAKGPERRFARVGMRVRCLKGDYAGLLGTVTDARFMKNNCRVEFDEHGGSGVTCGLELGEYLEELLDEQARKLNQLPVTMAALPQPVAKVDPYEQHRLNLIAKLKKEGHGWMVERGLDLATINAMNQKPGFLERRRELVAKLEQEQLVKMPAPVRFPHPGRNFELKGWK